MSCSVMVSGFLLMFVVYLYLLYLYLLCICLLLNVVCFLDLGVGLCIVSLCSGCDGYCVFLSDL